MTERSCYIILRYFDSNGPRHSYVNIFTLPIYGHDFLFTGFTVYFFFVFFRIFSYFCQLIFYALFHVVFGVYHEARLQ